MSDRICLLRLSVCPLRFPPPVIFPHIRCSSSLRQPCFGVWRTVRKRIPLHVRLLFRDMPVSRRLREQLFFLRPFLFRHCLERRLHCDANLIHCPSPRLRQRHSQHRRGVRDQYGLFRRHLRAVPLPSPGPELGGECLLLKQRRSFRVREWHSRGGRTVR